MNIKDIVTKENFYISDGGRIHFCYDEEEDGYFLCSCLTVNGHTEHNSEFITKAYIPNTINGKPVKGFDGDTFSGMKRLGSFIVEDDNPYFRLYRGGLYSKDMKKLYSMPPCYREKVFRVPDGVEYIMDSAISYSELETLIIPDGCRIMYEYSVACVEGLKRIWLPKSITFIGFKAFNFTAPEDVYYEGSEEDRKRIDFTDEHFNAGLINARWHYEFYECEIPEGS